MASGDLKKSWARRWRKAVAGTAVIATKVGLDWRDTTPFRNGSKAKIVKEVEPLRRLQTDVIDLYQVHWPDPDTPIAETAAAMAALHRAGKWAIGVSNFSPSQMDEFRAIAPLHTTQPPYNLFERGIESNVLPYAKDQGIVTIAYGALCRGLLSGRMTKETQFSGDDLRKKDPKFGQRRFQQYLGAVEKLDRFARDNYGKRVIHLALRWILDRADNTVALWGARRPEQLAPIGEVTGWKIDQSAMLEIDAILDETIGTPIGPDSWRLRRRSRRDLDLEQIAFVGDQMRKSPISTKLEGEAVVGLAANSVLLPARPSARHHALLSSYLLNLERGPIAVRNMIVTDVGIFLDLGASQRVADLLIVLRLFFAERGIGG